MRRIPRGTIAVAIFAVAACGGAADTTAPSSIAGTYSLQTVNGQIPPVVLVQDASYKLEILSGSYTINTDNTYSAVASFRETDNGVVTPSTESETGTYSLHGSSITFTDSDGFEVDANISGGRLTISAPGLTVLYSQ
jgi:hypothetical protein